MRKTRYSVNRLENGLLDVEQDCIGRYQITYNPDDNRFHVNVIGTYCSIATFAGNQKGYWNVVAWVKQRIKNESVK